jgi:hypothetical protein
LVPRGQLEGLRLGARFYLDLVIICCQVLIQHRGIERKHALGGLDQGHGPKSGPEDEPRAPPRNGPRTARAPHGAPANGTKATWLILPVVICLSQRLSHACLSIRGRSFPRNCEWLIKSVIVYLMMTLTRITVVILELIRAQNLDLTEGMHLLEQRPMSSLLGFIGDTW